ncbi:MAG: hypothetical protein N2381_05410 [Armatimonadetes bacterium]|nr:hypothetical protein [Armatimonadota bacterium]
MTKLMTVEQWLNFVSDWHRFKSHMQMFYGADEGLLNERRHAFKLVLEAALSLLGLRRKIILVRAPGRLNLMGRHIDHRGGAVNPIALSAELIAVAAPRKDDVISAHNVEAHKYTPRQFKIGESLPPRKLMNISEWDSWTMAQVEERRKSGEPIHWTDYIKGAAVMLQERFRLHDGSLCPSLKGMDIVVYGDVPPSAGLASSSALFMLASEALLSLNGLQLDREEFVRLCGYGEWYVGTRGGAGDHAAIKYAKAGYVSHITMNPLSVSYNPFPKGYKVVALHSFEIAHKAGNARDVFNQRVACYEFGFMLILERHPELQSVLKQFSDIRSQVVGSTADVYRLILELPLRASLREILKLLSPKWHERALKVASMHAPPKEGYPIRGVCLFGVSECERSRLAAELLAQERIEEFGLFINISHDGDRVAKMDRRGHMRRYVSPCSDAHLAKLIEACKRSPAGESEGSEVWRQPGSYRCSTASIDFMVDVANGVDGVLGAQLCGAGLGGCIMALVRDDSLKRLIEVMSERYYEPRGFEPCYVIATPVSGSCMVTSP